MNEQEGRLKSHVPEILDGHTLGVAVVGVQDHGGDLVD